MPADDAQELQALDRRAAREMADGIENTLENLQFRERKSTPIFLSPNQWGIVLSTLRAAATTDDREARQVGFREGIEAAAQEAMRAVETPITSPTGAQFGMKRRFPSGKKLAAAIRALNPESGIGGGDA